MAGQNQQTSYYNSPSNDQVTYDMPLPRQETDDISTSENNDHEQESQGYYPQQQPQQPQQPQQYQNYAFNDQPQQQQQQQQQYYYAQQQQQMPYQQQYSYQPQSQLSDDMQGEARDQTSDEPETNDDSKDDLSNDDEVRGKTLDSDTIIPVIPHSKYFHVFDWSKSTKSP